MLGITHPPGETDKAASARSPDGAGAVSLAPEAPRLARRLAGQRALAISAAARLSGINTRVSDRFCGN
jgi:hypothetical protein